jgi:ankyrin repeat protein
VANDGSDNVSILKNNGDGTFQAKVDYGAGNGPGEVCCGDLDGDTDLDLAVTNLDSDNISILKNNGDGTFQAKVDYGAGDFPGSFICADLDGDTDLDIAGLNVLSDNVFILLNRTIIVNVEDEEDIDQLPKQFSLSQNYPNPFNQSTKIEFALVNSGFVSLEIYDILGRKVRTLVSENLTPGYKSVLWNGKDNSGKEVASGIYFYQIKIGDFSEAKKLVLLK